MFPKNSITLSLLLISFFPCENSSVQNFTTAHKNIIHYNINDTGFVNFLENFKSPVHEVSIENAARGGVFKLVNDAKLQDDEGMVFPSAVKGNGWHWVRELSDTSASINIKFYGAKGIGLAGYKDDSAALVKAIKYIKSKGGGKLYIPASSSFYGFNGTGILLPDNIEIYGDGPGSQIKNVNPQNGEYYKGAVFFTTTYGPVNSLSIMRAPVYNINEAPKNQNYIELKNNADASNLKPGKLIGLGAGYFVKNMSMENKARYANFEINEVTKIDGGKIYLKYPLSVPLQTIGMANPGNANSKSPVIVDVNGGHTFNKQLNVPDRISRNIYIHDLSLSQADNNMIDNTPFTADGMPTAPVIALGGTFESRYNNLTIDSYGTFGGNLFNRCEISNLKIFSVIKFTDLGYGSANTKMHDIVWQYKPRKIVDTSTIGFVYLNDGTHDIEIYNVKASGGWNGKNLFVINGGGHNIYIHDVDINLPELRNAKSAAILIKDEDNDVNSHDITFKNINITVGGLKQFVQVNGIKGSSDKRNIVFDNITFQGNVANPAKAISIMNSSSVTLNGIKMSQGDIFLDNAGSAKIQNLDAPKSNIVNHNSKGKKPQVMASKYNKLSDN